MQSRVTPDGDGEPGTGGVNRGRADAPLTWGKESLPVDRFKPTPLPPGAARSPDDWAPLVELPGSPDEAPVSSAPAIGAAICRVSRPVRVAAGAGAAASERGEEVLRERIAKIAGIAKIAITLRQAGADGDGGRRGEGGARPPG